MPCGKYAGHELPQGTPDAQGQRVAIPPRSDKMIHGHAHSDVTGAIDNRVLFPGLNDPDHSPHLTRLCCLDLTLDTIPVARSMKHEGIVVC